MEPLYCLLEGWPLNVPAAGLLARPALLLRWQPSTAGFALLVAAVGLLLAGAVITVRAYRKYRASRQQLAQPAEHQPLPAAAGQLPENDEVAESSGPALIAQLLAAQSKALRRAIAEQLARLGEPVLPVLREALNQETDERPLTHLSQVCAQIATPAARQVLLEVAQAPHLLGRAAALRALSTFAPVPADAPLFHRLLGEEMQFAQHLVHGMLESDEELRAALRYELRQGQQRLFGLLLQVYERPLVLAAQRAAIHSPGMQANKALESLSELLSRPLYRSLQALLEGAPLPDQILTLDNLLGPVLTPEPIQTTIVRRGEAAFSAWTISVALRHWHAQPPTVAYLLPHLQAASPFVQESAAAVLNQLPVQRPAAYDHLLTLSPPLALLMTTPVPPACVPARERVLLLKGTALFAETPENILATIVPIMQEVAFAPGQEIFGKGTLGASLFIVCEGEVGIFDGPQQLATFRQGDFFGELALLDAEPRSATAIAHGPVVTFRLDQEDFYEVMEERSEVLRNILRVLCQRLRRQNEKAQPVEVSQAKMNKQLTS